MLESSLIPSAPLLCNALALTALETPWALSYKKWSVIDSNHKADKKLVKAFFCYQDYESAPLSSRIHHGLHTVIFAF